MYQRVGQAAYKANLNNTWALASHLEHPEKNFKSIHFAGTNGKGSTSHMLASVLQEAGYKVGLYTSPHLKDFRERIKINGQMIPEEKVVVFVEENKVFFESHQLSFFEMTVGLAFDYFSEQNVDIAVVEVGLGGRLDSTNIITPEVSVITNIGLDHTQFLGNTLAEIAAEKAGIIKRNIPVVIGETTTETKSIFQKIAKEKSAPIFYSEEDVFEMHPSDLKGNYQKKNQQTVLTTLGVLQKQGWRFEENNILDGLKNVIKNTGLQGRWQILQENPKIICDTAHNKEGLLLVLEQLQDDRFDSLHMVIGFVGDKAIDTVLPLFPKNATYYFCKPNIARGLDAETLQKKANALGLRGITYPTVQAALEAAKLMAISTDVIFVGGSTFVVAEIL